MNYSSLHPNDHPRTPRLRRLLWAVALVVLGVWSLFAWGAYALVGWFGGAISANADRVTAHPETVVWLSSAAGLLTSLGLAGVVVVWLLGIALILVVPSVIRLFGRRMPPAATYDRRSPLLGKSSGSATDPLLRSRRLLRQTFKASPR